MRSALSAHIATQTQAARQSTVRPSKTTAGFHHCGSYWPEQGLVNPAEPFRYTSRGPARSPQPAEQIKLHDAVRRSVSHGHIPSFSCCFETTRHCSRRHAAVRRRRQPRRPWSPRLATRPRPPPRRPRHKPNASPRRHLAASLATAPKIPRSRPRGSLPPPQSHPLPARSFRRLNEAPHRLREASSAAVNLPSRLPNRQHLQNKPRARPFDAHCPAGADFPAK